MKIKNNVVHKRVVRCELNEKELKEIISNFVADESNFIITKDTKVKVSFSRHLDTLEISASVDLEQNLNGK